MIKIECICTDVTYKTMYKNNLYIYYYKYTYQDKEYEISDSLKFKIFFWNPIINDKLDMYILKKDPKEVITPLEYLYYKIYLILSIIFIIIPFLLSI